MADMWHQAGTVNVSWVVTLGLYVSNNPRHTSAN